MEDNYTLEDLQTRLDGIFSDEMSYAEETVEVNLVN